MPTNAASEKRMELLRALERVIGECYNPNSTTLTAIEWGRDYHEEIGRPFQYPVRYIDGEGKEIKISKWNRRGAIAGLDEHKLLSSYYLFGSNRLHVFRNLSKMIDLLERDYGLVVDDQPSDTEETGPPDV